jgi:cytochrome b
MNDETTEGAGWLLFAGIMLMVLSILNIIWGIAAIDKANFFVANQHYIVSDLSTWGWVVLCIGGLQLIAAFSIWAGGQYGRWVGLITACFSAIAALMTIPAYPFWGLAIFAVDILVIYGLAAYGGNRIDA